MATTGKPTSKLSTASKVGIGVGVVACVAIVLIVVVKMGGRKATQAAAEAGPVPPALNKAQLLARNATQLHQDLTGFK